jgi:hypothetical protein
MFGSRRDIIGIDLGTAWTKAVVLRNVGAGVAPIAREYAMAPADPATGREGLERTVRRVLRKLRSRSRDCAVAIWPEGARLRVFDRGTSAVPRGGGPTSNATEIEDLFHEKLTGYVSVCGAIESCRPDVPSSMSVAEAVPQVVLADLEAVFRKLGRRLRIVQLAPMALLNAFTSSCLEIARDQPFLAVDFGRERALVIGGTGGVTRAVRVVKFPWESVAASAGSGDRQQEQATEAMHLLLKELLDVCDFLDAQDHHARLGRMHVSGAFSTNAEAMRSLGQALDVECVGWNPLRCAVAADRALDDFRLLEHLPRLSLATGVALQYAA